MIDVLMVWHSFMLNPRNYLEDCIRFGLRATWHTGMPWHIVNQCIDTQFNYMVPNRARDDFVKMTGRAWENSEDPMEKSMKCPRCNTESAIPWTTCARPEDSPEYGANGEAIDLIGQGYGERDFFYYCSRCGNEINHNLLRVGKFKRDTEALLLNDYPMGGTILSGTNGVPEMIPVTEIKTYEGTFPNRLIALHLRSDILSLVAPYNQTVPTMLDIKDLIEKAVKDRTTVMKVKSRVAGGKLYRKERLSIRKMMAQYWDNHQSFSLELSGAVIRQGAFVDKMHNLDWLHSPVARTTMSRLLRKYDRFFSLIGVNPGKTVVPTLDVDLAWHTHQLTPRQYYHYSLSKTRDRFIDHDDKIEEDKLNDYFEWTSKEYEKQYGEVYSECTCWYCEGMAPFPFQSYQTNIPSNPRQTRLLRQQSLWRLQARQDLRRVLQLWGRQPLSTRQQRAYQRSQRRTCPSRPGARAHPKCVEKC
jgi:hypothetical protein